MIVNVTNHLRMFSKSLAPNVTINDLHITIFSLICNISVKLSHFYEYLTYCYHNKLTKQCYQK